MPKDLGERVETLIKSIEVPLPQLSGWVTSLVELIGGVALWPEHFVLRLVPLEIGSLPRCSPFTCIWVFLDDPQGSDSLRSAVWGRGL